MSALVDDYHIQAELDELERQGLGREKPTHLYRHYNGDGELLYVGISYNVMARLKNHRETARWFDEIRRIEVQVYHSRFDAELAEKQMIKELRPRWNIVHNEVETEYKYAVGVRDKTIKNFVRYILNRDYDHWQAACLIGMDSIDLWDDILDGKVKTVENFESNEQPFLSGWQVFRMYCRRYKHLTEMPK